MGNIEQAKMSKESHSVEYPRFAKARFTVDKRMVLEDRYSNASIDLISKISSISSQNKKLPLLLPRIE